MAESELHPVIRHIRRLASLQPALGRTDRQLLQEFSAHRDEAAFAALVQRHGRLVLGVCRHVLHHHQDAEDAFQATFLVLARNAASIRNREALANWLHGVAFRTAMKAKRDAARRRKYEMQVQTMRPSNASGDLAWREVQALLDEETQRLPEVYRAPFVLCCMEGKSRAEAAEQLGLKEGTVSSRLARARKQLQERLARRGVALGAALGAVALTQNAGTAAIPPFLINATAKAALVFMTGKTAGTISGQAVALAEGAMKAMTLSKLKAAVTWVLGLTLLGAGAGLAAYQAIPSKPPAPKSNALARALVEDHPTPSPGRGPETSTQRPTRTDRYGDPLPPGALVRMGTMRLRHNHPGGGPMSTAISPGGKVLATGGWDEIRLWDLATGKLLREIRDGNRTKEWCALVFAPDGRWVAGAGRESVCIWDTATGRRLRELPASGQTIACSKDGKLLAASLGNGSIAVWNTATGKQTAELRQGNADRFFSIAFTADDTGLVTLSESRRVCHWDLAESKLRKAINLPIPSNSGTVLSPDGQTLAVTPNPINPNGVPPEGPTSLWDTTTGKERLKLQGALARTGFGMAFSADGKTLATNATGPYELHDETTIALWDAITGKLLRRLNLSTRYVTSLDFSPDGRTLLTTGHEPVLRLWDATTRARPRRWLSRQTDVFWSPEVWMERSDFGRCRAAGRYGSWPATAGDAMSSRSRRTARSYSRGAETAAFGYKTQTAGNCVAFSLTGRRRK
jgi:RNA polymerase sigma factor (sigma-70 family)